MLIPDWLYMLEIDHLLRPAPASFFSFEALAVDSGSMKKRSQRLDTVPPRIANGEIKWVSIQS